MKEKSLRRENRKFQKVGFKDPEVDEEDGNVVFPNDEENPDIMEDGEDFDPEKHEVSMINKIFDPVGSLFIDGNFYVEGEDMDYDETKLQISFKKQEDSQRCLSSLWSPTQT